MDLRLFRSGDKAFGIHGPAQDAAHWRRTVVAEERGLALGLGSIRPWRLAPANLRAWCRQLAFRRTVGLRRTFYAVLGMALSRSAVRAGWQRRQGVQLGLVQGDVGRGGVGGDLLCSFGADDDRGDRRAG